MQTWLTLNSKLKKRKSTVGKYLLWMSSTFIHGHPSFLIHVHNKLSSRIDGSDFYPCPIYPNFLTIVRSVGYLSVTIHSLQLSSLVLDLFVIHVNRTLTVNHYCFYWFFWMFRTHPADYALRDIWSQCSNFIFKFIGFWNNFL